MPKQLAIKIKADTRDMTALLVSKQISRPPQFEVAHRDPEACTKLVVLPHGGKPLARLVEHVGMPVQQQVCVCLSLEPADAAAQLVQL